MQYPQPHTGSYYAASANESTDFAPLDGAVKADVCVIGAGFTGISTALHLAERGYDVHVVEANKVGWGASGRNGGQMIGGIAGEKAMLKHHGAEIAGLLWEMRWAGNEIIRQRVQQYGIQCDLKAGYLDVAIKDRHVRALREEYEYLKNNNFPHEFQIMSRQETRELIGTDAYIGALKIMGNGHLHPLNLCVGEAQAAVQQGATIYEQSPVLDIEKSATPRVITENGSVSADFVVLAGNAYQFLDKRLRSQLFPVNSFIIATEPLSDELIAEINPEDLAVCDPNFILEYFRLSADKRLLFGGRINYFGDDPEVIKMNLKPRMCRIYPQLANIRIDYAWGGTIGVTLSRVPQMGRIAPNIIYSQGYSGHGVNVTHLAGQILADAIAGTLERFDVFARIKPITVPGSGVFSKQMVALGMVYYRLRDLL
ncbi:MAG: FAD-binding oxidoreductase [Gammaproteobacteria bacterium]|nr:MAG: FAD-binding oxidoreductase [Gammaproteobacteria bacterium]